MKTDKNQKKTTVTEVYGSEIVTEQINEAFLLVS